MREIVHIQAGQCGNQIGTKVSQIKCILFSYHTVGFKLYLALSKTITTDLDFIWKLKLRGTHLFRETLKKYLKLMIFSHDS